MHLGILTNRLSCLTLCSNCFSFCEQILKTFEENPIHNQCILFWRKAVLKVLKQLKQTLLWSLCVGVKVRALSPSSFPVSNLIFNSFQVAPMFCTPQVLSPQRILNMKMKLSNLQWMAHFLFYGYTLIFQITWYLLEDMTLQ